MSDDEEETDPMGVLADMGFTMAEASEALLKCHGDLGRSIDLLTSSGGGEQDNTNKQDGNASKKGKKNKKKKGKQNSNTVNHQLQSDNEVGNDCGEEDGVGVGQPQQASSNSNRKGSNGGPPKSFKEQRKQELRFKKALRDQKKTCRVCGGSHPRKECPGIADDGRGHSRHKDKNTRAKENKERKQIHNQKEKDQEFLQRGTWTHGCSYHDGFADLIACYYEHNKLQQEQSQQQLTPDNHQLLKWLEGWSTLQVSLGDASVAGLTRDQRKKELKTWAGSKLRALSQEWVGEETVQVALKQLDPRSEMINIILECEYGNGNANANKDGATNTRTLSQEWPGYRGCIMPISILDKDQCKLFEQLLTSNDANEKIETGIRTLLACGPAEISKWMVASQSPSETEFDNQEEEAKPIDIDFLTRVSSDLKRTEAEMKKASDNLLAAKNKKTRSAAQAEVARLRQVLESQRARKLDHEQMLLQEGDQTVGARLSPMVARTLDTMVHSHKDHSLVVGVSCGLDYDTPAARHPRFGGAIRQAQKDACTLAVRAATKAGLPIVLECHEAEHASESSSDDATATDEPTENISPELASSDLVRILAQYAPPETTLVLRCGALTTAPRPGLSALLQTWPNLYVGLSAKLAYAKCPKALLDAVFDLPLDRIIFTSEAPNFLPPCLSGSSHLVQCCLPPHMACVAESVSSVKGSGFVSREDILKSSAKVLSKAFGI